MVDGMVKVFYILTDSIFPLIIEIQVLQSPTITVDFSNSPFSFIFIYFGDPL